MKRFLLLFGAGYYHSGGGHDFAGDYDTIEEAKAYEQEERAKQVADPAACADHDWWHIVDTETQSIVSSGMY